MNVEKVKEYIRLTTERRKHEDKAKELAAEIAPLREELIGQFQADGMQRTTVDGHTAYLRRDLRAGANKDWKEAMKELIAKRYEAISNSEDAGWDADAVAKEERELADELERLDAQEGGPTEALAEALKAAGLGDMVKEAVNANTLAAWVREHDPDKVLGPEEIRQRLPEVVRPCVSIYELWDIGVTKA